MNPALLLACSLFGLMAFGQSEPAVPRGFGDLFNQAPPHIDRVLRERVLEFYRLQQFRRWRQADMYVHPGSKDAFFEDDKVLFRSFKLVGITYEENFTRAKVVVDIDTEIMMPGHGMLQVNRPLLSLWKSEGGEWWWHTAGLRASQPPVPPAPALPGRTTLGTPAAVQDFSRVLDEVMNMVQIDRSELVFPCHKPDTQVIVVTNRWEAPVRLKIDAPELAGLTLTIDQPVLGPGRQARVTVASRPETRGAKAPVRALLQVDPLGKTMPIEISFLPPPVDSPVVQ